jgi:chromosome segregation ATPase
MEGEEKVSTLKEEIAKLREQLDGAKLQLEQKDAAFVKLEGKVNEYESLIESSKTEKLSLEERIIELSDSVKKFEAQFVYLEKKPYLEQLKELEDPEIFEMEKDKSVEWLKARLEKVKKEKDGPQVQTKTLEDEKAELEDTDNKEKEVPFASAFRNNPTLAKEIASMKEETAALKLEDGGWY